MLGSNFSNAGRTRNGMRPRHFGFDLGLSSQAGKRSVRGITFLDFAAQIGGKVRITSRKTFFTRANSTGVVARCGSPCEGRDV